MRTFGRAGVVAIASVRASRRVFAGRGAAHFATVGPQRKRERQRRMHRLFVQVRERVLLAVQRDTNLPEPAQACPHYAVKCACYP